MSDTVMFCPACFADQGDGSWNHVVIPTDKGGHCTNCGNGSCVPLPKWAIESIRQQASWVGKRYYPNAEDCERSIEREALLSLVRQFPGRTATQTEKPDWWLVSQNRPNGGSVQTMVTASDADAAMRRAGLTYYTAEQLSKRPEPTP